MCGAFLTGIFATSWVSALDGIPTLASGGIDGNGVQIAKQLAEIAAIAAWSFTCSVIMLYGLKYVPGLHLRVQDDIEEIGLDLDQFFDETIGEWSLFEQEDHARNRSITHGVPVAQPPTPPSESMDSADKVKEEAKAPA